MAFPAPSEKQAKVLWFSLTALALAIFLALLALLFFGVAWLVDRLSPVLLPLAIAGIVAFLLNPMVDFFEGKMSTDVSLLFNKLKNPKRVKSILLVFLLGVCLISTFTVLVVTTVVPKIMILTETVKVEKVERDLKGWASRNKETSWGKMLQLQRLEHANLGALFTADGESLPKSSGRSVANAIAWIGLLAGVALVPVYVFYFLLEALSIEMKWIDYLPL